MSLRVLLIDDEPALLSALSLFFLGEPHEVTTALGGEAGLAAWRAIQPHFTLMDLRMPGMDGFDVLGEMQKSDLLAQCPVVILSGHASPDDVAVCKALGASDVWLKPLDHGRLFDALDLLADT